MASAVSREAGRLQISDSSLLSGPIYKTVEGAEFLDLNDPNKFPDHEPCAGEYGSSSSSFLEDPSSSPSSPKQMKMDSTGGAAGQDDETTSPKQMTMDSIRGAADGEQEQGAPAGSSSFLETTYDDPTRDRETAIGGDRETKPPLSPFLETKPSVLETESQPELQSSELQSPDTIPTDGTLQAAETAVAAAGTAQPAETAVAATGTAQPAEPALSAPESSVDGEGDALSGDAVPSFSGPRGDSIVNFHVCKARASLDGRD